MKIKLKMKKIIIRKRKTRKKQSDAGCRTVDETKIPPRGVTGVIFHFYHFHSTLTVSYREQSSLTQTIWLSFASQKELGITENFINNKY